MAYFFQIYINIIFNQIVRCSVLHASASPPTARSAVETESMRRSAPVLRTLNTTARPRPVRNATTCAAVVLNSHSTA